MPHSSPKPEVNTLSSTNDIREHLLGVAIPYAGSLRSRPGLAGIMLYGSLVRGSLTPFSDIDMAVFYEGEPPWGIEHRVVEGIKVDLISFPLDHVTKLLQPVPRSLDVGFPFSYVLESLLLAGDDSILFDPAGELLRVKTRLARAVSFEALNRVSISEGYHEYYCGNLEAARTLLERGDIAGTLDKAIWSGRALAYLLRTYTITKDTREGAVRLGIPGFADRSEELASILAVSAGAVEAVWAATRALWDYTLQAAAGPVRERLRAQGVSEPDRLELVGDYNLFWPRERLHEFGRVMDEVDLSLRWCRHELDQGNAEGALQRLWSCRGSQHTHDRWSQLSAALRDTGYDCSSVIEPMLETPEFVRLAGDLDEAIKAIEKPVATPEAAQRAMTLTDEMERMLLEVISFLTSEELAETKRASTDQP